MNQEKKKNLKRQHIMTQSKECQEQMRNKVSYICQSMTLFPLIVDCSQDFCENILWTDETKVELFEGVCPFKSCAKLTAFQKNIFKLTNMVVVV